LSLAPASRSRCATLCIITLEDDLSTFPWTHTWRTLGWREEKQRLAPFRFSFISGILLAAVAEQQLQLFLLLDIAEFFLESQRQVLSL